MHTHKPTVRRIAAGLALTLGAAASTPAAAQHEHHATPAAPPATPPPAGPAIRPGALTLDSLYREVARRSPRAEAARALARAAAARVPSVTRPPDPQLQLGLMNYALPGIRPMDGIGMTQLQLMQMVPVGGKLRLAGRVAGAQASAADERAADAGWEVRAAAAAAFYELHRIDASLAVARETLRLLRDARALSEAMYRVGDAQQADVLRAQVAIARMVEDTTRMTAMRAGAAARLNAIRDADAATAVATPALPAFPASPPSLATLAALADSARPMVRAAARDVEASTAEAARVRRELWPDLAVGVQLGRSAGSGEMGEGGETMGSVMVGASLPVFARSRQLRMREEAAAMRQMATAELAAMRADTRARVAEAHADLTRARNLVALYRTTVIPQSEAAASSSLSAYRVGRVDFMALLDARMTVNGYRQELAALESEEGRAWAELEMLTGRELLDPSAAPRVHATRTTETAAAAAGSR